MASINFNTELGKQTNLNTNAYTFKDLHFDVAQSKHGISNNRTIKSVLGKDIMADIDEAAITNSIFNILNTRQGQRFLIPQFGCNLLGYIGRPITTITAQEIGQTIYNAIRLWEPRVTIDNVLVVAKPNDAEYDITIKVSIPTFKRRDIRILATLTNQGILKSK
jgi:phage baseplate assembly protein W